MRERRVAARYAEALFDLARDRGEVADVREEVEELVRVVAATPELGQLLARPDLDPERKLSVAREALGERLTEAATVLLATLLHHRRGDQVAAVAEVFGELADDAAGVARAEVRTVVPLTEAQRQRLAAALSRITGRQVELAERIDPEVLAGVRVEVGGRLIDGSAASRLARLREELVSR